MIFDSIPTQVRTPFTFVEFNSSQSSSASSVQPYKLLLMGQKLAGGTATAEIPVRIQSKKQANTLFGAGSMLAAMCRKSLDANNFTETWAIPILDNGAGVAATSSLVVTGPATGDGTIALYIGGKVVQVGVLSGDTAIAIAAKIITAITADSELLVSAVVDGTLASKVNLTAKHKGAFANDAPLQLNYNGESLPAGVAVTTPALSGGTTNPSIAAALSALGDEQYRTIVMPYTDTANLVLIEAEMARRWGPQLTNDGHAFTATQLDSAAAASLGLTRNSPHLTILINSGSPTPAYETAAVLGAVVAFNSPLDQARPLQTLALPGVLPPAQQDRLILAERNVLLYAGIATTTVDAGGLVRVERLITTYREDGAGNLDESYLDYETMATLSFLRFDFRAFFGKKYPRHKLGKDGTRYGASQPIMTPRLAKAEAIGLFGNWEEAGLVEDSAQFERDIIVEVDSSNPNRLNFYLPPNLMNGLRVLAAQIAFRS